MSVLKIETPRALIPLLRPARYKGAHGGRGSGKSHFFAELMIEENISAKQDNVCLREVQKSLEFSVKHLLEKKIEAMNAGALGWHQRALGLSNNMRTRVARWAIHEWANEACPPRPRGCGGALEVPDHQQRALEGRQPMRTCPICKGMGRRYWSDGDRIQAMGAALPEAMTEAHSLITRAESLAVQRAKQLLERD